MHFYRQNINFRPNTWGHHIYIYMGQVHVRVACCVIMILCSCPCTRAGVCVCVCVRLCLCVSACARQCACGALVCMFTARSVRYPEHSQHTHIRHAHNPCTLLDAHACTHTHTQTCTQMQLHLGRNRNRQTCNLTRACAGKRMRTAHAYTYIDNSRAHARSRIATPVAAYPPWFTLAISDLPADLGLCGRSK